MKSLFIIPALALALSGCFIVGKSKSTSQPSTASGEPKNRGQARKQEVHERNAERKEDKDAMKDAQKASKGK